MEIVIVFLAGTLLYYLVNKKNEEVRDENARRVLQAAADRDARAYGSGCLSSIIVGMPLGILAALIFMGTALLVAYETNEATKHEQPTTNWQEFNERYFER